MKILISQFTCRQLGGIINHTEELAAGLIELGHAVDMSSLHWVDKVGVPHPNLAEYAPGYLYPVNQYKGWAFPANRRIPYKGAENIKRWLDFASKFDVIIWQMPIPTLLKGNRGNMDWMEVYNTGTVNIAVAHDAWFQKRNAHFVYVKDFFDGFVTVHTAGYNNAKPGIPKVMIINPHDINPINGRCMTYKNRVKGFLAAHYFKKVKRMDDLIRAIPYMEPALAKMVAGFGIEYNYMNSITGKCKYFNDEGQPIWNEALEYGLDYLGVIHSSRRDYILSQTTCSVDPSWHEGFARAGAVWNRASVEAIVQGTIVVATDLGISGSDTGNGVFWHKNKNYIAIPYGCEPWTFAEIVNHACNLSNGEAASIQNEAFKILPLCDRKFIAQQYIDFANGTGGGFYGKSVIDKIPKIVYDNAADIMKKIFQREGYA